MTTTSGRLSASAHARKASTSWRGTPEHAQDPFCAVEAYLAQAQNEIGRAFLELESDATTPGGSHEKHGQSLIQVEDWLDSSPPCDGDLEQLSAWAETFARELEDSLQTTHDPSCTDHDPTFAQEATHTKDTAQSRKQQLLPVKYSSLPPRSAQSGYHVTSRLRGGHGSSAKSYKRHSWPLDCQRALWEDKRVIRQLTRDASVQTDQSRYSARMEPALWDNEEGLVLPSQCVFAAKQALKVPTSTLGNNYGVVPKRVPRMTRRPVATPGDHWLQCLLLKGSAYTRLRHWRSEDEDYLGMECKELPRLAADVLDVVLDSAIITSLVSRHELESFLRKVENSAYRPPSSLDGASLQDAETQTSPDLSPSSSFTWVTDECDCSPEVTSSTRWRLSGHGRSSSSSLLSSSSSSSVTPSPSPSSSSTSSGSSGPRGILGRCPGPLTSKSVSAPVLRPLAETQDTRIHSNVHGRGPLRAHSDRQLTELEAAEACVWLRAAGFPQYAQMYEDNQFPIDISGVRKDHQFLDPDAIYALFRRLNTLNKCARIKNTDGLPRKSADESDSEEQCALSENWQFQHSNRRWSRVLPQLNVGEGTASPPGSPIANQVFLPVPCGAAYSEDSVFSDDHTQLLPSGSSPENGCQASASHSHCHNGGLFLSVMPMEADNCAICCGPNSSLNPQDKSSEMLRRSGSERLKDGARAFFRRVESFKGKRKKNREVVIIGGPAGDDKATMLSAGGNNQTLTPDVLEPSGLDSSDLSAGSSSRGGTPVVKHRRGVWLASSSDNGSTSFSDSECTGATLGVSERKRRNEGGGSSSSLEEPNNNVRRRPASFKRSQKDKDQNRGSFYDNVPVPKDDSRTPQTAEEAEPPTTTTNTTTNSSVDLLPGLDLLPSALDVMEMVAHAHHRRNTQRRDSGVGASLTRTFSHTSSHSSTWHCFSAQSLEAGVKQPPPFKTGSDVASLAAYQLSLLRKMAFLKATTMAEKHCPASRHANWNWGVTRLLKKIRAPDYKDKTVFGVPLSMVVQRNGGLPLPPPIQIALCHLHATALDAQGLFRKSGVRSRIQRLRLLCENPSLIASLQGAYDQQQAYDVGDLVKQYFREVPDSLLTAKQSEILINVYQHVPEEERLLALRMCILYLPDENREALQCLLYLLHQVSLNANLNQMSSSNLGVCLAPSIFQLGSSGPASSPYSRSASASPRRRRNNAIREGSANSNNTLSTATVPPVSNGMPDQRELDQSRAAHTCLTDMIQHYKCLFMVPDEAGSYQRVPLSIEQQQPWEPIKVQEMGTQWQHFSEQAIQDMIKECRDKPRAGGSWSSFSLSVGSNVSLPWEGVEVWLRKVSDGYPLRLWKACVEVEAPPADILHRILRERPLWDANFVEGRVMSQLDSQSDIYLCWASSLPPHPLRQFCTLRSWRQERGACYLAEASVDHPSTPSQTTTEESLDSQATPVTALVLASRYLLEPCGAGRTRVTHISRIDLRGRSLEWYTSVYGHYCANLLTRLRESFRHGTLGPETKV